MMLLSWPNSLVSWVEGKSQVVSLIGGVCKRRGFLADAMATSGQGSFECPPQQKRYDRKNVARTEQGCCRWALP